MVTSNVRLVELLGAGGMGDVWTADHLTLKTQVAVKFIHAKLATDNSEALARFNREASAAAQIKSAHVVQTFDQGIMADGTPFIVMELVEGEELADRLERDGMLRLKEAAQVVAQSAKALASAHDKGIVHRDIKPENIFLTRQDGELHVKIFDFGIAKQTKVPSLTGLTEQGHIIGTPEFMSPEQLFNSKTVDFRADLWSLAVVAYCALTASFPFEGETLPELCKSVLSATFQLPSSHRGELPAEVDLWFERALHSKIDKRFQSAKEMAVAFVRAIAQARIAEETEELEDYIARNEGRARPGDIFTVPTLIRRRIEGGDDLDELEVDVDLSEGADSKPPRRSHLWLALAVLLAAGGGVAAGMTVQLQSSGRAEAVASAQPPPTMAAEPTSEPSTTVAEPTIAPASEPSTTAAADASASSGPQASAEAKAPTAPRPARPAPAKTKKPPATQPGRQPAGF